MSEKDEAWRSAFDERHQFDVYPDHFMTGLRNEFAAGWHAALKGGEPVAWRAPNLSGSGDAWAYRDADDRFEGLHGDLVGEALYLRASGPKTPATQGQLDTLNRLVMILEAGQAENGIDNARAAHYADALRALLAGARHAPD